MLLKRSLNFLLQRCTTIGLEFTWDRLKERMKPHFDDIPELDSKSKYNNLTRS